MGKSRINNGKVRREIRQATADERKKESDKRSINEKIARLDKKFGEGQGAKKERERLTAKLQKQETNPQQYGENKRNGKENNQEAEAG
jgi:hypothetical protein